MLSDRLSDKPYVRVNKKAEPDEAGEYMLFGSYPASLVSDETLTAELRRIAGARPRSGDNGAWTSYKYYKGDGTEDTVRNTEDFMWYQDIEHGGERYRGVYFTSYRPCSTIRGCTDDNSYQPRNGYECRTVYWFKYEPLLFHISAESDGKACLVSTMLIDAQEFQSCATAEEPYYICDSKGRPITDIDGNRVYANNYAYSMIRGWLNDELYYTAFNDEERERISLERVDNSLASTACEVNEYICADTEDYITLPSAAEVATLRAAAKKRFSTDYAKVQGIWVLNGKSTWLLRSPNQNYKRLAQEVDTYGWPSQTNIRFTYCGIRPMLWIKL